MVSHPSSSWSLRLQMAGLLLWRGGLAFVLAWGFYYGAWRLLRQLPWAPQVLYGLSIATAGLALVMLSLILERREAARKEGNLLGD